MQVHSLDSINKLDGSNILDEVKKIVCSHFDKKSVDIYLFGSWSKGKEKRTSDIDIGIICKEALPEGYFAQVEEELEQSNIPYKVDLVDMTDMLDENRRVFLEGAILWRDCNNEKPVQ